MMENDVVWAGPPNNSNNEFEVILTTIIHVAYKNGGCFIAFSYYGIPESLCRNDGLWECGSWISIIPVF